MPTTQHADDLAIQEQAYYFWEQDGRPEGRETEYWQRAVVSLREKSQTDSLTKPAAKKAKGSAKVVAPKPKAAPKLKAAASKAKSAPLKAEPAKKPKKK